MFMRFNSNSRNNREDKRTINTMLPVENKVVIIDAGHGGFDPGKTGKTEIMKKI